MYMRVFFERIFVNLLDCIVTVSFFFFIFLNGSFPP